MSNIKFTENQNKAINHSGANLLVSAAAGSGKTAVVANRAVKLLVEKKVPVNRLLLITFTRAAASEMRQRVADEIKKYVIKDNSMYLKKQLRNLPDADICTIDSYLTKFLRRNFHTVGLDPAFSIISEDEKKSISKRAIKKILSEEFEDNKNDFISLCDTLGGKGARDLEDLIESCYEYARKYPNYIAFIKSWPIEYDLNEEELLKGRWMKEALKSVSLDLALAISFLKTALNFSLLLNGPSNYADTIENEILILQDVKKTKNTDDFISRIKNIEFAGRLPGKNKNADEALVKNAQKFRGDAKKIIGNIKNSQAISPLPETVKRHKTMHPAISALSRIILSYDKEITKVKKRYKTLDFGDLMHYTLLSLENKEIKNAEKLRYEYIFVDEYQDTNSLQEILINSISKGDNLFCVGDVKQSIYSFRQAEPELFIKRMNSSYKKIAGSGHLIALSDNFRSSAAVVDFINIVFDNVMTRKTGGVDYKDSELLKCYARRPEIEDENSKVELIIINAEEKNPKSSLSNIEYEAIIAADIIKDVMSKPIYDGKLNTYRAAKYEDICILSSAFKPIVRPVRRILEQRGIPVTPFGQNGYLDEIEITTIIDILKIIDNHHRDLSLISAMISPAFCFEIDELIKIRSENNAGKTPFYFAVEKYASNKYDALASRLAEFLTLLDKYRLLSKHMPIGEFIWHVLIDTMFYDAIGALPGGRIRQQNLRILAERADSYSMIPGRNLSAFINHITTTTKSSVDFEPAQNSESTDSIKFMSIHKSKGLEFPVVILINTASMGKNNNDKMLLSGGLVPGVLSFNSNEMIKYKTLSHEALKANADYIKNAEKLRVLYVALTRAKERLCVIGTIGQNFKSRIDFWALPKDSELLFRRSFLDILAASAIRIKGSLISSSVHKINILNIHSKVIDACDIKHDKKRRKNAVLDAMEKAGKTPYPDDAFSFSYKHESFVPAKTTATALLNNMPQQYENIEFLNAPDFMQESAGHDTASRGTFTHIVMQIIDFNSKKSDIIKTIKDLIYKNILPKDAVDAVDVLAIERFLNSDTANRIRNSKTIKREQPFVISIDAKDIYINTLSSKKVLVQGVIDVCFIENDKWIIIDYKTNKLSNINTPKAILKYYENQLKTYSKALGILTKNEVSEVGIYLLSESCENAYYSL